MTTRLPQVKRVLTFTEAWANASGQQEIASVMIEGGHVIVLDLNDLRAVAGIVAGVKNVEGMAAVSAVILRYETVNQRQKESIDRLLQRIDELEGRGYAQG